MSRKKIKSRTNRPHAKISETLVKFAEPLITFIGGDAPKEVVQKAFLLATTVWNGVVREQVGHGSRYVDDIKQRMNGVSPLDEHIDALIERKRARFAHDTRTIGHQEVVFNPDGSCTVRAEIRKAPSP